jgi:hypothetical protein
VIINRGFSNVIFFILLSSCDLFGQNGFAVNVKGINRTYEMIYQKEKDYHNRPLIILMTKSINNKKQFFHSDFLIAIPIALGKKWYCDDGNIGANEVDFIKRVRDDVYLNFKFDRNRFYILVDSSARCLAERFVVDYPQYLAKIKSIVSDDSISYRQMLGDTSFQSDSFERWSNPLKENPWAMSASDSLRRFKWKNRIVISINKGGFYMLNAVNTGVDDQTYMDISRSSSWQSIRINGHFTESSSWVFEIGWLRIDQKQEIGFSYRGSSVVVKGEGGGGAVIPVSVGLKYSCKQYWLRPYILLGTGITSVLVFGGQFKTTSSNLDPSAMRNDIQSEIRVTTHVSLESGCDWRVGKRMIINGHVQYLHSSKFKSAGQVDAIKGVSASIGLGYVIGIKRL